MLRRRYFGQWAMSSLELREGRGQRLRALEHYFGGLMRKSFAALDTVRGFLRWLLP
jgi:hypothetical protein